MPKLSIIVPVYNAEKYISACIESILNQTYADFELLLIDDGSLDSSSEICKGYAQQDHRINYIYKKNGGVSSARNEGIRNSNGEYLCFIDSDDMAKPEMVETLVANVDFSMCGYELYDDSSNTATTQFPCHELYGSIHDLAQNIADYIAPPFLLGPCFKLFKRSIVTANDLCFPPELSYGEDAVFVMKYLAFCETVKVSSFVGYSYRKHGSETLSGRFLKNKIDINHRINCLLDDLLKKESIASRDQIIAGRMLECMVSYEKELINSSLAKREKRELFYEKFNLYKDELGKPRRLAQRIIVLAGKYRGFYPLVYLFNLKELSR